ncbi:protein PATRONUS 2 [Sesbania bispinosa]|nr:protein PATRONUS 2 [Sesbania bispinosa]
MATRTGRLFQDQNLNAHVNGAGIVPGKADFTGQRKGRAGGRKPLGDLSNAGKPLNQVDGKKAFDGSLKPLKSKNPNVIMNDEAVSVKAKDLESNKRTASKASEKSNTGSRKALSDISNSGKPHVPEIGNKNNLKPCAIAEEQILHNHKKCIKSQFETVDMHHFYKTVGLEDDSDDRMKVSFELPAISKLESESAYLRLEEVPERLPEGQSLSAQHGSPAHCKTPKLSSCSSKWSDFSVNFKLIETPKVPKN